MSLRRSGESFAEVATRAHRHSRDAWPHHLAWLLSPVLVLMALGIALVAIACACVPRGLWWYGLMLDGAATAVLLGTYGRVHDPTGETALTAFFSGQLQFLLHPLVTYQPVSHAGVMNSQGSRRGQGSQQVLITFFKQSVIGTLVNQLQGADALFVHHQRRTKNGAGNETGFLVDILGKIRILADIPDNLAGFTGDRFTDDPPVCRQAQSGYIYRSGTATANEFPAVIFKQKN